MASSTSDVASFFTRVSTPSGWPPSSSATFASTLEIDAAALHAILVQSLGGLVEQRDVGGDIRSKRALKHSSASAAPSSTPRKVRGKRRLRLAVGQNEPQSGITEGYAFT